MHLKIIEPAEIELHDAFEYYEIQNPGLGKKFMEEFNKGISRIKQHPKNWTVVEGNVRKCILNKFPYNIIYAVENKLIVIIAIAHQRRKPDYWIERIK